MSEAERERAAIVAWLIRASLASPQPLASSALHWAWKQIDTGAHLKGLK